MTVASTICRRSTTVARLKSLCLWRYLEKFDEIYELLSRESAFSGQFDASFRIEEVYEGTQPFDELLPRPDWGMAIWIIWKFWLKEILAWHKSEVNYLVQQLINRIIFSALRRSPARDVHSLKNATSYDDLKKLSLRSWWTVRLRTLWFPRRYAITQCRDWWWYSDRYFQRTLYPKALCFCSRWSECLGDIYELFPIQADCLARQSDWELYYKLKWSHHKELFLLPIL